MHSDDEAPAYAMVIGLKGGSIDEEQNTNV